MLFDRPGWVMPMASAAWLRLSRSATARKSWSWRWSISLLPVMIAATVSQLRDQIKSVTIRGKQRRAAISSHRIETDNIAARETNQEGDMRLARRSVLKGLAAGCSITVLGSGAFAQAS